MGNVLLMNRDIELSCDERVVRLKGEANKNSLKERITAIMKTKKITIISIILAFVLIMSSILILASSCSNADASNITSDTTEQTAAAVTTEDNTDKTDLFLPDAVEKSFFENKVLANITDAKDLNKMTIYYTLSASGQYLLDPNLNEKESGELLDIYRKYTNLTGNDIIQMCKDSNIPYQEPDAYANVRFGDNKNILLLDVVWYTADEYEQYVENYKNSVAEYKNSDAYAKSSDDEKKNYDTINDEGVKSMEQVLNEVKNKTGYASKIINGKPDNGGMVVQSPDGKPFDISQYCDVNGYYIINIYPYYPHVAYNDKNGNLQVKSLVHPQKDVEKTKPI